MKEYDVNSIISDVRTAIDESEMNTELISVSDSNALSLDKIIRQKIEDGARNVLAVSPSYMLDGGITFPDTTINWYSSEGSGSGYVPLPTDYLRLSLFKMSDWHRPVTTPISDSDPEYFLQKSKFLGIKGGIDKPVCVITTNNKGSRIMEFYSCKGGTGVNVDTALYYPYPKIDTDKIKMCENLHTPTIYYIAGLVCETYAEYDKEKSLIEIAYSYIK